MLTLLYISMEFNRNILNINIYWCYALTVYKYICTVELIVCIVFLVVHFLNKNTVVYVSTHWQEYKKNTT